MASVTTEKAELFADLREDLQALDAQSLEGVRRSTRFVSASTEELGAGSADTLGHCECLLASFHATWASHDSDFVATNGGIAVRKANDSVRVFYVATNQLIRLGNLDDLGDAGHLLQRGDFHFTLISGDADSGALRAWNGMGAISQFLYALTYETHVLFGSVRFHDD